MKKKFFALTMAAAMTAGLLAGCGNDAPESVSPAGASEAVSSESTGSAESKPEETKSEETKPEEIVNITVFMNGMNENAREQEVIDAMNDYSAEKIGVTITYKALPAAEYKETVSRSLAAKDDIDVCFMATYTGLIDLARGGALLDITDYIHSPEYADLYAVMPETIWNASTIDGKNYCVPNYKESAVGYSIITPASLADTIKEKYGIDFQELNVKNIWEFQKFEEYLEAAVKEGVAIPALRYCLGIGAFLQCDDRYEWVDSSLTSLPFLYNKETQELSLVYENEDFLPWFTMMKDWNEKGFFPEEELLDGFSNTDHLKAADYGISGWTTVPDNQQSACDRYGVDVYVNEFEHNYVTSSSTLGSSWAVAGCSQKADAALKWIQLVETDTYFADLFIYGIEGTDYTRTAEGAIEKIKDSGWTAATWKVTSYETASVLSAVAGDYKEQYTKFNNSALSADLMGFKPNYEKVQSEKAALTAVQKEVNDLYLLGYYGPENLEETVARFREAGADAMMSELQAQLDEYLANQGN